MKTTIEIADELLERAKRRARRERKPLRQIVEDALRRQLAADPSGPFQLKRRPFRGKGLQPGVIEGRWEEIRDLTYRLSERRGRG